MDMHSGQADAPQSDVTEQLAVLEPDPLAQEIELAPVESPGEHFADHFGDYEDTILRSVN